MIILVSGPVHDLPTPQLSRQRTERALGVGCGEDVPGSAPHAEAFDQVGPLASDPDEACIVHKQPCHLPVVALLLPFVRPPSRYDMID